MIKFLISLFVLLIFTQTASADWATARYSSDNAAAAPYIISEPIEALWESGELGHIIANPVVDTDGNIYLNVYNQGLKALDKNGAVRWMGPFSIGDNPVIDQQGNLYASEGSCGSFVYSLDKNGQEKWRFLTRPEGEPCGNFSPGPVALSRDQKTVYSSRSYPGKTVLALNAQSGALIWEQGLNGYSPEYISVGADETVYVGTGGSGYLFALGPAGIKWQGFTSGGSTVIAQTPMLDSSGNVYTVSKGAWPADSIVSFTPAGLRRWIVRATVGTTIDTLPALKNQRLYFSEGKNIKAVDTSNGTVLWEWTAPISTTRSLSPLAIDQTGNIYGALANKLFVIDENGQTKNTLTVGTAENYLRWVIIPQDDLILLTKHHPSGPQGFVMALGKKQITKTPLILIPGIGGSELKVSQDIHWSANNGHGGVYTKDYKKDDLIWVNIPEARALGDDDYFDILRLKPDGQAEEAPLTLTETMYEGYRQVIPFFEQNGYRLGQDLFVFNYDWRKDLSLTSASLDAKINTVLTTTGASKVDIITHSMGGLVAREYIRNNTRAQKVAKLIQLGTPHLGAVKFIKAVNEGICLKLDIRIGCLSIAPSEVKDVLQNMPGGYALLPSSLYYQFYDNHDFNHIVPVRDDADNDQNNITGSLTFDQAKSWLLNLGRNTTVLNIANAFHDVLDASFPNNNNVDISLIAGSGLPTIGQIHTYLKTNWLGQQKKEQEEFYVNGDKTVPLFSASLTDGSTSLAGTNKIYYVKQEHGALMETGNEKPALPLVISLLNNQSVPDGVATVPFAFVGTAVSTHSPVELHVYDSSNNHTGPTVNNEFETQIPDSFYETSGESKYVFLSNNGQYRFEIKGTDNGTFDLKLQNYANSELNANTLYRDVPVTTNTVVRANYDSQNNQTPALQVDTNNDGNIDQTVNLTSNLSGPQAFDLTPPVTMSTIQGLNGQDGWYRSDVTVELNAQDNPSGSGILTTEYSLDNGATVKTYSDPIILNQSATIQFRSIDKAGNEEVIKSLEIKIDKIPPEVKISFDPQSEEFKITGIDNDSGIAQITDNGDSFTVTDMAGNSLIINLQDKDQKRSEKISIKSLYYNGTGTPVVDNSFKVSYALDKKTKEVKKLEQEIKIERLGKIRAKWNGKKDRTTVIEKEIGQKKEKQIIEGLKLLRLETNKGNLSFGY